MPPNEPNNGNQRVTNMKLSMQIEAVAADVREVKATVKEGLKDHDERIRANELAIVDHSVQLRIRTAALTGMNLVLSALAALAGRL